MCTYAFGQFVLRVLPTAASSQLTLTPSRRTRARRRRARSVTRGAYNYVRTNWYTQRGECVDGIVYFRAMLCSCERANESVELRREQSLVVPLSSRAAIGLLPSVCIYCGSTRRTTHQRNRSDGTVLTNNLRLGIAVPDTALIVDRANYRLLHCRSEYSFDLNGG